MEKRKWPWKKKSSEKSGGESESSESISSHSERFSDEQEAIRESTNENTQSPEVTSQAKIDNDDDDDKVEKSVKSLTEKLSAALVNVGAKEELVKQHAKVAEEAVAGWEKAENEVTVVKQQLEAAVQHNLSLEVKNSHLDGALKECVRQLRQARDEQEKRISDALAETNREWESKKADFERRILDLQAEAEAARAENSASVDLNTVTVLEALEKEKSSLKHELVCCHRELEVATIERDLSTQAAETASKLHLESIKKVAKLEAECRRLQSVARKSSPLNSQKSVPASSFHADSFTESRPDFGERIESNGSESGCLDSWASTLTSELDQFKNEKPSTKSLEIDMMDDFLEMERLAALSETKSNAPSASPSGEASTDKQLIAELDLMTRRVADLENMLEKTEAERSELQNALDETVDLLKAAESRVAEAEIRLGELRNELAAVYDTNESLEFQLSTMEEESRTQSSSVDSLKAEIEDERKLSSVITRKCQELENKLSGTIQESELQQIRLDELQNELAAVYETNESLESQLSAMKVESTTLSPNVDSLKAEIEDERKLSSEITRKCQELENKLTGTIQESELQQIRLDELQNELAAVYETNESLESQLSTMKVESTTLSSNVDSLKAEIEVERKLSAELTKRCQELENELTRMVQEFELQQSMHSNSEPKVKQEDLAVAADKLADCQKTIASLGRQLQSLATLEDFFIDPSSIPGFSRDPSSSDTGDLWRLPSNGAFLQNYDAGRPGTSVESYSHLANGNNSSLSTSSPPSTNHVTASKNWNSFGKFFSRSKSVAEHENGQE